MTNHPCTRHLRPTITPDPTRDAFDTITANLAQVAAELNLIPLRVTVAPPRALVDFREYRRDGGVRTWGTWWQMYAADYQGSVS